MNRIKAIIISMVIILGIISLVHVDANAQQNNIKLSGPELSWVIVHPLIAVKAKRLSKRALFVTDSIEKLGLLKDRSGGQLDAFKHAFWMALLAQNIKPKKAYKLGKAHEKYNYNRARKGKGGGDQAASNMDLWNNDVGIKLGSENDNISESALIELVINAIRKGKMKIIRKNLNGDSLDCDGQLIDKSTLKTWVNKRCLVASNYEYN